MPPCVCEGNSVNDKSMFQPLYRMFPEGETFKAETNVQLLR